MRTKASVSLKLTDPWGIRPAMSSKLAAQFGNTREQLIEEEASPGRRGRAACSPA